MAGAIQPLPAAQVTTVQSADRAQVAAALAGVLPLNESRWFPRGNGYVPSASDRIETDSGAITAGRKANFLKFLSGAVFTHCGDAWGFVGRALDALLKGDLTGAIHLVYYAELRATLSLLASEGIFIGNRDHFVVTPSGIQSFGKQNGGKKGTHSVAWQALQAWTEGPRAQAVFGEVVRPGGETFTDWVASLTTRSAQAKIDALFKLMSLDLREFDQDHRRRNTASYNPSRLSPRDMTSSEVRDLLAEVWQALEPGIGGAFPVLDEALLPELLRSIFTAGARRRSLTWATWVDSLAPASQVGTALLATISAAGPVSSTSGLVGAMYTSRASEKDPVVFLRPMMARTVLLLRIATGSAVSLLRESSQASAALKPWIDSLAEARGLWPTGAPLASPLDLWADVELALNEAEVAGVGSLHELLSGLPTGAVTFGQGERVPVWSFA